MSKAKKRKKKGQKAKTKSIKEGDFVRINYTSKIKETGEIFDTTIEEIARKEKLYKEGEVYDSKLVVVGEGWVLKALDAALLDFKVNKSEVVEIPKEKAFGDRDPEKVRLLPLRRLIARGITPKLGMQLEYEGKLATVRTMGSGRVQLDFNPLLAGKTLIYEIVVEKKIEKDAEKIGALIKRRILSAELYEFKVSIRKKNVTVTVPEEAFYIEGLQLAKRGIATDIQRFFSEIATVKFIETFRKREPSIEAK